MEIREAVESTASDWQQRASFDYSRQVNERGHNVWAGFGTRVDGKDCKTLDEILCKANLDFEVFPTELYFSNGSPVPKARAIVREAACSEPEFETSGVVTLGIVGEKFTVLQNARAFESLGRFVESGHGTFAAAGVLRRGAKVFTAIEVEKAEVRKGDVVYRFLMVIHGHDGKTTYKLMTSDRRISCSNQIMAMMAEASKNGSVLGGGIKHTASIGLQLDQLEEAFEIENQQFGEAMAKYRAMAKKKLTTALSDGLFRMVFPSLAKEEEEGKRTRLQNKVDEMKRLATEGMGNDGSSVWDAFNGISEYLDHEGGRLDVRAESTLFGDRARTRERAFAAALQLSR